jgi:signal peptidase I
MTGEASRGKQSELNRIWLRLLERVIMGKAERVILSVNILLIMFIALLFIIQPGIYWIYGDSMEPTLYDGDKVLIGKGLYTEGDIIAVRWAEKRLRVMHRLYRVDGNLYYTWGDNNPTADDIAVTRQDIIGKLLYVW